MCKQNKNKGIFIEKTKNDERVGKKKERVHIRSGAECVCGGGGGGRGLGADRRSKAVERQKVCILDATTTKRDEVWRRSKSGCRERRAGGGWGGGERAGVR